MNQARKQNPALQATNNIRFHSVSNEHLLCYSKICDDPRNLILVVVNLDFENSQVGIVDLPLGELGLAEDRPIRLEDLLGGETFTWQARGNYVKLDPISRPVHIFRVQQ